MMNGWYQDCDDTVTVLKYMVIWQINKINNKTLPFTHMSINCTMGRNQECGIGVRVGVFLLRETPTPGTHTP